MRSHGRYVSNTKQKRVISGSIQGVDGYILKAWETCLKGGCLLLFFLPTTGTLCIVSRAKTYHMPRHITCHAHNWSGTRHLCLRYIIPRNYWGKRIGLFCHNQRETVPKHSLRICTKDYALVPELGRS